MSESTFEPQEEIQELRRQIEARTKAIRDIAKEHIPEFHFLNHRVSDFWRCDKSPIGWCVWDTSKKGFNVDCRCHYCNCGVERK